MNRGLRLVWIVPVLLTAFAAPAVCGDIPAPLRHAERGDAIAQRQLGEAYYWGQGVTQDHSEAAKWFRKAADHGDAAAPRNLGIAYCFGQGVPQDYAEAAQWYRKAAEQGDATAQFNLGVAYFSGQGVPQDYAEAAKWFRKAAEQGDADGQRNLGVAYYEGQGVPQDYAEAVKWYRKAAEQGNAQGQRSLGFAYDQGKGVPQDYKEAAKWFRKAAEQGDAPAQRNLAIAYDQGKGVPQDHVLAHLWFNLAATQGATQGAKNSAELRDSVASKMTQAQIAEAQKLAREWRPASKDSVPSPSPQAPRPAVTAAGTGFAVRPDGFVLTAHHVVSGGDKISVRLADGQVLAARVVKFLRAADLAILKIETPTPSYLELADRNHARSGDRIFTIGYPASQLLGNEATFAEGTVSSLSGPGDDATFLQMSVPIQPGNSGGPVVNEQGFVVGIVAATASVETFFRATGILPQSVNWAVNADFARTLFDAPKTKGVVPKTRQEAIDLAQKAICYVMQME